MLITVSLPSTWPEEPGLFDHLRAALAGTFPVADVQITEGTGDDPGVTLSGPGQDPEDQAWDQGVALDLVLLALEDWLARPQPLTLALPPEFVELCTACKVAPELVLRGFIADLCDLFSFVSSPRPDGYSTNGYDERRLAKQYFDRCGYAFIAGLEDGPQ